MKRVFALLSLLILATASIANSEQHTQDHSKSQDKEFDPVSVIMHHISDAHYWHLYDRTDKETGELHPVSIPLPIILLHEGKLDVFMSSEFHHGESTVKRGDREYIMYHGVIYLAINGEIQYNDLHQPMNVKPFDFSITKNVASLFFSAILLLVVFLSMARMYKKGNGIPRGIQGFLEPIIMFIVDDIAKPNIGEHKYQKYLPYLLTVFFFIWFNNMLGLIPIIPGGANLTGNIAVTMTLAVFTLLITNFSGNKNYWKHVFATPGVPWWLSPIMIPVELIGIISKPFALMIRLFANITAGHIIVLSLISLIFVFKTALMGLVSVPFVLFIDILELLVAILQAYIFTLLSALFIGLAVQEHH
jgi:F-type H+-transporting ATPase subunit a